MRTLIGIGAGVTLAILVYVLKQPALDLIFYRDKPKTPTGHMPKMRTFHLGVATEGPWT